MELILWPIKHSFQKYTLGISFAILLFIIREKVLELVAGYAI
jgi:hypothetical protein